MPPDPLVRACTIAYYIGNSVYILCTKLIKPSQLFLVLFASNPSAPPLMLSGSATGMSVAISWTDKMQLAKCVYMVSF